MPNLSFETFGLDACLRRPPQAMGRIHHHHEVEINYIFSGGVTYLHSWKRRRMLPRRLTVFWGSSPHSLIAVEPGTEMAWITVPLPHVLQWQLPEHFIRGLMEGRWWVEKRSRGEPERFPVRAWVRELERTPRGPHNALLLELQACLLRLAEQQTEKTEMRSPLRDGRAQAAPASWRHIETMARYMAENFREDVGVDDVARAAGLHAKYAMQLFRRECGITIGDYLARHRLTQAQRLLITGDAKILEIALASGFRTVSAFYAAFMAAARMTPRQFRRRMSLAGGEWSGTRA